MTFRPGIERYLNNFNAGKEKIWTPLEIKRIRKLQYGLTQVEFAELLGVSYGTFKAWEIGRCYPCTPAQSLLYVAKYHPEYFLESADERKAGKKP